MSEKKNKQIQIPLYNVEEQMNFISSVCADFEFDPKKLIPLILADWICTFQEATSKMSGKAYPAFISYLKSTTKTYDKLNQIREYIENGNKQ